MNYLKTLFLLLPVLVISCQSRPAAEKSGMQQKSPSDTTIFPTVTGKNLKGETLTFPGDLRRKHNLLAVAFQREQQAAVDTWIPRMENLEDRREDFAFYELPTIRKMNPLSRWFIYEGMRSGIPSETARARTVTLHIDKAPFKEALGIPDEKTIYLYLTNREGRILWETSGTWSQAKQDQMVRILNSDEK